MNLEDLIIEAQKDSVVTALCDDIKKVAHDTGQLAEAADCTRWPFDSSVCANYPIDELIDYLKYSLFINLVTLNIFKALKTKNITIHMTAGIHHLDFEAINVWRWTTLVFNAPAPSYDRRVYVQFKCYPIGSNTWNNWYDNPAKSFKTMPVHLHGTSNSSDTGQACVVNDLTLPMLIDFVRDRAVVTI